MKYNADANMPDQLDGSWQIVGDKLSVTARPLSGPLNVKEIAPDKFVLDFTVLYTFTRGPCSATD